MDKAVFAGRVNGPFVEACRINFAALDASDFGADHRGAVFEVLGAMPRPELELSVVSGQRVDMLLALVGWRRFTACGAGERAIKVVFGRFGDGWR